MEEQEKLGLKEEMTAEQIETQKVKSANSDLVREIADLKRQTSDVHPNTERGINAWRLVRHSLICKRQCLREIPSL